MRWAALSRRPPILGGVSASHIRADHAVNQARVNARYGPALPSSPQLCGEADAAYHSTLISSGERRPPGVARYDPVVRLLKLELLCQVNQAAQHRAKMRRVIANALVHRKHSRLICRRKPQNLNAARFRCWSRNTKTEGGIMH